MVFHWKKRLPVKYIPKKTISGWSARRKRYWLPIVEIHSNYYYQHEIKELDKPTQRLYFLYMNDFETDDTLLNIMQQFDIYHYTNLTELKAVLELVGFPPVPTPWLMLKWMYLNPVHNSRIKLRWRDLTHPCEAGKTMKPRYCVI